MRITIVPKDSVNQRLSYEVVTWFHSHGAFSFVMEDGSVRVYPDAHVWYIQQEKK